MKSSPERKHLFIFAALSLKHEKNCSKSHFKKLFSLIRRWKITIKSFIWIWSEKETHSLVNKVKWLHWSDRRDRSFYGYIYLFITKAPVVFSAFIHVKRSSALTHPHVGSAPWYHHYLTAGSYLHCLFIHGVTEGCVESYTWRVFACVLAGSVGFTREFVAPCERVRLFLSPSVKAALPASSLRSDATDQTVVC